jgi:hypothetical protein
MMFNFITPSQPKLTPKGLLYLHWTNGGLGSIT